MHLRRHRLRRRCRRTYTHYCVLVVMVNSKSIAHLPPNSFFRPIQIGHTYTEVAGPPASQRSCICLSASVLSLAINRIYLVQIHEIG